MGIERGKRQAHLKAAETSGMSLIAYAAQHGINVHRLYESRYREARAKAAKARQSSVFVPVKVRPAELVKGKRSKLSGPTGSTPISELIDSHRARLMQLAQSRVCWRSQGCGQPLAARPDR
jgi:hypothetical protein